MDPAPVSVIRIQNRIYRGFDARTDNSRPAGQPLQPLPAVRPPVKQPGRVPAAAELPEAAGSPDRRPGPAAYCYRIRHP